MTYNDFMDRWLIETIYFIPNTMENNFAYTPEMFEHRQRVLKEILQPFVDTASGILLKSIPKMYVFSENTVKPIYEFQTLRALGYTKEAARQTCLSILGLDPFKKQKV